MKTFLAALFGLALAVSGGARAAPAPAEFDVGPAVGARAPAFTAVDAAGKPRPLASVMGRKGVVLVFFRSAKWCPFCQAQLISLRDAAAPLAARGYPLAAISYDPPAVLTEFASRRDVTYALLSDAGSKTIDAWGLRDPAYKPDSYAYGVPRPAIFVLSRSGVVKAKLAKEGYKVRPDAAAILAAVDAVR